MNNQSTLVADHIISKRDAPTGEMGQALLISGEQISMRLWEEQPGDGEDKSMSTQRYETVGYVLEGKAELHLEDERILLEPGMSWLVPQAAEHSYKI